ncbi:diguanylate cyclase [Phormidium sp. LEGE 05292]|uniref:diguanylate cyclase domain-containing protein n=1 Tax=[Phormidium] sp. LEGE 05292 TaxID=767427 RepID=UPI0018805E40|nr:diguanylate cyclase [Phormidium sp. LEGE 05292]MBE9224847.1 diguanylate cyclase [Phormidium sp. LEGE 05292]
MKLIPDDLALPLPIYSSLIMHYDSTEIASTKETEFCQAITVAIDRSVDFQSSLKLTLDRVCELTGWDYGEAWIPRLDGSTLEYSPVWYGSSNLESLRKFSKALTFPPNVGLPGRVWLSKQPELIPDISQAPKAIFARMELALTSRLKAGLAIPILVGDYVLAVLVFFMFKSKQEDYLLINLVFNITTQLGEFFEIKRIQEIFKNQYKMLEIIAEGVSVSDELGNILFFNNSFCTIFGYAPEELIGKNLSLINRRLPEKNSLREITLALNTQGFWSKELNNFQKDGTVIITNTRFSALTISGKQYWVGVWENITAQKQGETELQKNQQKLASAIDLLPGIPFHANNNTQWSMKSFGKDTWELTGYKTEELLGNGSSYNEIVYPEDLPKVLIAINFAISKKQDYQVEYRICTKSGEEKWVWEKGRGVFDNQGEVLNLEGIIIDITERKQAEESLRKAEIKYRSIFENAVEGIFQSSVDGRYLIANQMLAKIYGYKSVEELLLDFTDINCQLYVDPNRRTEFMSLIQEQGAVLGFESQIYRKDRSIIWISENASGLYNSEGKLVGYEGTVVDITERKRAEATIQYQAFHDLLTTLPNRALFNEKLIISLENAPTHQHKFAVMFLDLDRFKKINDTLGHAVGDRLLQNVAERLKSCLREGDTVARWGGDEFTILLTQILNRNDAGKIAQRIIDALKLPFYLENQELHTSTSVGIAVYPEDGEDVETLLKKADSALYEAKKKGRNNYQYYMPKNHQPIHLEALIQPKL